MQKSSNAIRRASQARLMRGKATGNATTANKWRPSVTFAVIGGATHASHREAMFDKFFNKFTNTNA